MEDNAGELVVEISGRDVNLSALLTRVEAQLNKADQAGQRAGKGIGDGVGNGAAKASTSTLALASAQARLSVAQGDVAGGIATLRAGLQGQDQSTVQAVNATRQLVQMEKQLEASSKGAAASSNGLSSSLKSISGALAAGGLAIGIQQIVQLGSEMVTLGAQSGRTKSAFDELSKAGGTTGNAMLASLRQAAKGEISDLNLQLAANRANLLGVAKSAEDLSKLMDIARDRARKMGTDVTSAFNDLVTGLGRASPMILDNLGITVKVGEANEKYAATLGKSSSALTDAEKKQALINAVMAQGAASTKGTTDAATEQAAATDRASASWENFKARAGEALLKFVAPAAEGANQVLSIGQRVEELGPKVTASAKSWDDYKAKVSQTDQLLAQVGGGRIAQLSEAQFNYAQSLISTGTAADQAFAKAQQLNGVFQTIGNVQARFKAENLGSAQTLDALSNAMLRVGASGEAGAAMVSGLATSLALGTVTTDQMAQSLAQFEAAQLRAAQAAGALSLATDDDRVAIGAAQVATEANAKALTDQATQSQLAAIQAQELTVKQEALAQQAQQAASVILAGGGNIAGATAQLAASSSNVDQLTAAYLRLAAAQAQALNQKLKATPLSPGGEAADVRSDNAAFRRQQQQQRLAESQRKAGIDRQLAYDRASTAERLKMTQQDLASTKAYSDQWVKLKEREISLQASLDKKSAGGAKAAGATKLSDQQKLENTLAGDQDKFDQQAEDKELEHRKRLLDIEREYDEKMSKANQDYQQNRLEGDASFYDNLGSIESDKIRKSASAAYEAAAEEASKIAQEKGADVADKYMQAQEQVIQARAKRQADIEKAVGDKDKDKAAYLRAVDEKYRKAEEARLAAARSGDDSIAAQHDKQLADEAAKTEEAQGKVADAAERSADRKVAAAERAGKAVDLELAKAGQLANTYDRIAPAAGRAPAQGPQAGGPTAPGAEQGPGDQPLKDTLEGLKQAIAAVEAAVRDSGSRVEDATSKAGDKVASSVKDIHVTVSGGGIN